MNYEASRSSRAHALAHPHHSVSGPLLPARIRDHIVAVLLVERNDVRLGGEEDVRVPMARRFCLDSPEDEGAEAPVLQRRVDQEREEDARGGAGPRDLHYLWTICLSHGSQRGTAEYTGCAESLVLLQLRLRGLAIDEASGAFCVDQGEHMIRWGAWTAEAREAVRDTPILRPYAI